MVSRNIWGSDLITAAVEAFKTVVHEGQTLLEALQGTRL
jgi:DhnA family fructose-bisphosphate aldolase class Ia